MKFIIVASILVVSVLFTFCTGSKLSKSPQSCNTYKKPMTIDEKKLIVSLHNERRNKIALGADKEVKLPLAKNMIQMYWSDELMLKAQDHANKCTKNHSDLKFRTHPKFTVGENMYTIETKGGEPQPEWAKAVEYWYSFSKKANAPRIDKFSMSGYDISAFTQLVWARSYLVGCGFSVSTTSQGQLSVYVCLYGPSGNITGQPVYLATTQKSCNCLKGLSCGNTKLPGLCCPDGFCKEENYIYTKPEVIPGTTSQ